MTRNNLPINSLTTADARSLRQTLDRLEGDDSGSILARRILTAIADEIDPLQMDMFAGQQTDFSVRPAGTLF